MPDPRFFHAAGPFTLAQLAEIAGAKIHGGVGEQVIHDVAPLDTAGADDISFLDNPAYTEAFAASKAGVCIVGENLKAPTLSGMTLLIAKDAYRAYAFVAQAFYPDALPVPGVGAGASVDPSAIIGEGSEIAPGAVIGANVEIGKACLIGANAVVGIGVKMGDNCDIGPLVSLKCAVLGHHVRIMPGHVSARMASVMPLMQVVIHIYRSSVECWSVMALRLARTRLSTGGPGPIQ